MKNRLFVGLQKRSLRTQESSRVCGGASPKINEQQLITYMKKIDEQKLDV